MDRDIERHLRWLMVLRLVTVSTLLLSVFILDLVFSPVRSPLPFYFIALFSFGLSLLYGVMFPWFRRSRPFLLTQLLGDALIITAVVSLTGGPESTFSFLYLVVVLAASVFLYRRGAFSIAGGCWVFYSGMVWLHSLEGEPLRWLMSAPATAPNPARIPFLLVVHFVGFFSVAFLSSYVTDNLRRTREELLRHRERVAQLQAYHENIIGSITSGLITTDGDGQIDFVNPGAEQILGRSRRDLLQGEVAAIIHRNGEFLPELRRQLTDRPRVRFEDWFPHESGRRRFLGFTVSRLRDKQDRELGFIFSFQDLTDRKALEEEVQLQKHMAAIGGIAARMAHEIRNPLASITGSVQLLKRELPMEPSHSELMRIILTESRRLDGILRDFLAYARPSTGRSEKIDAVVLVKEAVKLLQNSEECGRAHRIETRFRPDALQAVLDPDRIRQVIWNLARNGLKSMPAGGTLTIGVEPAPEERFRIFFEDQGSGMTGTEVEDCFQPFRGGFEQGTGLGLSIVYRVVQEHGGRVQIQSDKGHGTRVEVLLPVERDTLAAVGA
jgi:two-component system sensor histidine kinase PilS (NtrC family)